MLFAEVLRDSAVADGPFVIADAPFVIADAPFVIADSPFVLEGRRHETPKENHLLRMKKRHG